ncbi:HEAT repeat domain-containing protein [Candidatus Dojkabacteria bacterium]|nr:HEAT repeat domain-containing protein [Candidatus Dojkabacteria bacterium]
MDLNSEEETRLRRNIKLVPRYKNIVLVAASLVVLISVFTLFNNQEHQASVQSVQTSQSIDVEIKAAIAQYNFSRSELETVAKIKAFGEESIPVLTELIHAEEKKTRYIAYISLSGLTLQGVGDYTEMVTLLKDGLDDPDLSIRVQVAQLLFNFQEKEGIPVLIEALDSDEVMTPSSPPMKVSDYAYIILTNHIDQDFGVESEDWLAWWEGSGDDAKWDETNERFVSE